jgi:hypothetical protein
VGEAHKPLDPICCVYCHQIIERQPPGVWRHVWSNSARCGAGITMAKP